MIVGINSKYIEAGIGTITWINRNLCNVSWVEPCYILSGEDEDVIRAIQVIQEVRAK
jgi:hypothetical protein